MKKPVIVLLFLIFAIISIIAQTTFCVIDIQKNSTIKINGTTNLLSFELTQKGDKLSKRNFIINATQNQNKIFLNENEHSVNVKDFNSSNKMALRDFLKLVKADSYPTIGIKLNYVEVDQKLSNKNISKANVSVDITITGKTKQYSFPVTSNHDSDSYTLKGTEKLNIRDFGLEPPVEMMGLIRVNEWIKIEFNIICKINFYKQSPELNVINAVKYK
jgi:hypothetical protein